MSTTPFTGIPRREWLAVLFPPPAGAVLLVAGAVEAERMDTWGLYVVVAVAACILPLAYTAYLARRGRLFLRSARAIESNRLGIGRARRLALALVPAVILVVGVTAGSAKTVLYGALGGAAIGLWPALLVNFLRLWREQWAAAARR